MRRQNIPTLWEKRETDGEAQRCWEIGRERVSPREQTELRERHGRRGRVVTGRGDRERGTRQRHRVKGTEGKAMKRQARRTDRDRESRMRQKAETNRSAGGSEKRRVCEQTAPEADSRW